MMLYLRRMAVWPAGMILLCGTLVCAQPPAEQKTPPEPAPAKQATPEVAAPVDPNSYEIGVGDVIRVQTWRDESMSGTFAVRPDGKITMQLLGDLQAAGLTPKVMAAKVTEAMSKLLNNPQVTVSVLQVMSKRFSCVGRVNRPGTYPMVEELKVLDALVMCGGLADFAKKGDIRIQRGTEPQKKFNYNEVIKGRRMEQNIVLKPGDYVIVR